MDHDKLNRLLELLEGTSASELEYAEGDWKVRLVRGLHGRSRIPLIAKAVSAARPAAQSVSAQAFSKLAELSSKPGHIITAGLTGTFYRSPAPDQAPFVSVGDTVHEGQTIGVVEAMKLLNTIEADCDGRVVKIFADDGATVSADSTLFEIEPLEVSHV